MNILNNVKTNRFAPNDGATTTYTLAAGTTSVTSVSTDVLGFSTAAFAINMGAMTATATGTFKIQGSLDGSTNWTDITGATKSITDADADKVVLIEVNKPMYRYLRVHTTRGVANSIIYGMTALLGGPRVAPVTHGTLSLTPVIVG